MGTFTSHDGATLHYDVRGADGDTPMVVLAGGPARHPDYLGDLAGLDTVRRLLILHQRGVGRSVVAPDQLMAPPAGWLVDVPGDTDELVGSRRDDRGTPPTPVLAIAGARDAAVRVRRVVALAELFSDGTAVTIPDAGHYPWVEQAERFYRAVASFLQR